MDRVRSPSFLPLFLATFSASARLLVPENILTSDMVSCFFLERCVMDLRSRVIIFEWMAVVLWVDSEDDVDFIAY